MSDFDRLCEEGRALMRDKAPNHVGAAIAKFSDAIAVDPRGVLAWVERSVAHRELKEHALARSDALQAFALGPVHGIHFELITFALGREEKLLRRVLLAGMRATRRRQDWGWYFNLWMSLDRSYGRELRHARGLQTMQRMLRVQRSRPDYRDSYLVHTVLSQRLAALGRYPEAIAERQKAVGPGEWERRQAAPLVWLYFAAEDFPGAQRTLEKWQHLMRAHEPELFAALIAAMTGQPFTCSDDALACISDSHRNSFYAAVVRWQQGQHAVARPELERFIARWEGNPREGGVTMRWEVALGKKLLAGT